MLTAVIFDFDGIIVDTEPLHYQAFQEILVPLGMGYSWDEYMKFYIGFDDRDAFRHAFRNAGSAVSPEELHDLILRKASAFNAIISRGVKPYPGVVELILGLKRRVPVALCSGALRCDIDPILGQLGLSDTFDSIVTADDVAASKPDPASYRLALQRLSERQPALGIDAGSVVAIEDTPAGIASAKGAGLAVLAVTNSYPSAELGSATGVVASLTDVDFDRLCALLVP